MPVNGWRVARSVGAGKALTSVGTTKSTVSVGGGHRAAAGESVISTDQDPLLGWGLRAVELGDKPVLDDCFATLAEPLSDYTFSQLYTWRNSLRILWKMIRGHLCVFANGTGDLTLLMPPIGDTGSDAALAEAFDLMNAYNDRRGVLDRSRVEYVSAELLSRFDGSKLSVVPMGGDYVYDVGRMIDLAGGDLASKRQAKNRFIRNYSHRVEEYSPAAHRDACLALLDRWKVHQDESHMREPDASALKRSKESTATALSLETAAQLGMKGLVVFVDEQIRGFTFGEYLGRDQSSITIEKTDLETKGLAQFIFSEFCRTCWADRPLVNVGDDWGLETLAWTKQSYRPVKRLDKFVVRRPAVTMASAA